MYKAIFDKGYTTKDLDYGGAINAFLAGEGGVQLNGTWVVGDNNAQSQTNGTALNKGGLELEVKDMRAFMPAGQVDLYFGRQPQQ